jgi:DNA-binding winged helix-turn-helix (wHTH) protein
VIYRFGIFEFEVESGRLRKDTRPVPLERQPARVLAVLLAHAGEVVSRDELRQSVWGRETHVDFDRGLAYCLSQIRGALGDRGDNPRFVQTFPKRGYKFVAPVAVEPPFSTETGSTNRPIPSTEAARSPLRPARVPRAYMLAAVSLLLLLVAWSFLNGRADTILIQAHYVLLGQLQQGEKGLRFVTHFIRLRDMAHLKANRLQLSGNGITGLEVAVVDEFERAAREHLLTGTGN